MSLRPAHMKETNDAARPLTAARHGERGYALVGLLALMTVMMFAAMAVAPSLRQQTQRERELEAIARGEEVAEAIRAFVHYSNRLPTSMDELVEGAPYGTKKLQVLRASAARDPLSKSGEWRLIRVQDREFAAFLRALVLYTNGGQPQQMVRDKKLQTFAQVPSVTNVLDLGNDDDDPCGGESSVTTTGPFIGVASSSCLESVVTYYGIERTDKWVFTPLFR